MASDPVVHLHTHSEFSVRDGLSRVDDLCAAAAADGQPAIAVTDHGGLGGTWRLAAAAKRHGIKPIFGCELYLEMPKAHVDEKPSKKKGKNKKSDGNQTRSYHHLTVLAESEDGWRNLLTLTGGAHQSFHAHPLTTMEQLANHSAGLVVLTGCLGGPVKSALAAGDLPGAVTSLGMLESAVGRDQLYVEVMSHGIAQEDRMMDDLLGLGKRFGLPVVATNDSHFTHSGDDTIHDAWLCNGTKFTVDDEKRFRFDGAGYWLRTTAEMRAIFDGQDGTERAVSTTLEIAERCAEIPVIPKRESRLPAFTPDGDPAAILHAQVLAGARRLYGDAAGNLPKEVRERLRYESDIIEEKGFCDYFLLVADMIGWAKDHGYQVGPGRGSAAGSVVSYCLGIIAVDPLAYGLRFERFLSPTRVGMPDIDTDFEDAGRGPVVSYLAQRWGAERVARIGTWGVAQAKAACLTAGRVLGASGVGVRLSATVPNLSSGTSASLAQLTREDFSPGAPFRSLVESDPKAAEVAEVARGFEGTVANATVHACGVVIGDEPLPGLVPLRRDRTSEDPNRLVTEWDGGELESAGFLKVDILGVKNLSIVSQAVRIIEQSTGELVDPEQATDDPSDPRANAAWEMIAAGRTAGVFQLESSGMTDLAIRIRPQSISDLSVIIALYRPGPMGRGMHDLYADRKSGLANQSYDVFTKDSDEIAVISSVLDETLGIPVYQEQLMSLGEVVAGFGPVERDRLRHAVGKKVQEEMDEVGEMFLTGATSKTALNGEAKLAFSRETATRLWDAIKSAADYAFNKAHSVGYAKLAYENALLKANWPAAYAAAWLSVTTNSDKRIHVLSALDEEGVKVLGPDVNASGGETTLDAEGAVRIGLAEIKGIGTNAGGLISEREERGSYVSLADLVTRTKASVSVLEGLIEAGACDGFGRRRGMVMVVGALGGHPDLPIPDAEWGVVERAARERDRLGISISTQPLVLLRDQIVRWRSPNGGDVRPVHRLPKPGGYVNVVGVLASITIMKKKTRFARIVLAGSHGSVECVMWADALTEAEARRGGLPAVGSVVGVHAKVQAQREFRQFVPGAETGTSLGTTPAAPKKELVIQRFWTGQLDDPALESWAV